MNTPQLKGTATEFIEVFKNTKTNEVYNENLNPMPICDFKDYIKCLNDFIPDLFKTIAVWHITPHPFIDINQFKTN